MFYIILAASIIVAFILGTMTTYFIFNHSRKVDMKIVDNLNFLLYQRDTYISNYLNMPPPTAPQAISHPKTFGGRSDEEEAAIEESRY